MLMEKLTVTCDSSGAGTAQGDNHDVPFQGGVAYAVQLIDGTFDDGVDVVITSEQGDLSIPILTKADFNTDQIVYPRAAEALNTDGTALTMYTPPLVIGPIKVVVAQGGDAKSGSFIVYVIEG